MASMASEAQGLTRNPSYENLDPAKIGEGRMARARNYLAGKVPTYMKENKAKSALIALAVIALIAGVAVGGWQASVHSAAIGNFATTHQAVLIPVGSGLAGFGLGATALKTYQYISNRKAEGKGQE